MNEIACKIQLLSDVVVTADGATEGGHAGLDYLPGSLFLGAVAARLKKFDPDLLLSGRVRFLNAYPVISGQPSYPIPLCFYKLKDEKLTDEGLKPINLLFPVDHLAGQPERWGGGYMTAQGEVARISLQNQMKSAIDRDVRRSKDGALFSYSAIPAGTVFSMRIQADDPGDLKNIQVQVAGKRVGLGRSRSAEFGDAHVSIEKTMQYPLEPHPCKDMVVLYLASDLALVRNGMPVLLPEAADFGLEDAVFLSERSFMQTRRYSPWNAFYNCRMTERQVLCKGSVIAFKPKGSLDLKALQDLQTSLQRGLGLHVEEGLGQILVNPKWVLGPPALKPCSAAKSSESSADPGTPLTKYLAEKADNRQQSATAFETGIKWAEEWHDLSKRIEAKDRKVPGKSQWANIRNLARLHQAETAGLRKAMEAYCTLSLRKKVWVEATVGKQNLMEAVLSKVGNHPGANTCLVLHHAAVEMGRKLGRDQAQKEK